VKEKIKLDHEESGGKMPDRQSIAKTMAGFEFSLMN
jgi:hypothetical protein